MSETFNSIECLDNLCIDCRFKAAYLVLNQMRQLMKDSEACKECREKIMVDRMKKQGFIINE